MNKPPLLNDKYDMKIIRGRTEYYHLINASRSGKMIQIYNSDYDKWYDLGVKPDYIWEAKNYRIKEGLKDGGS